MNDPAHIPDRPEWLRLRLRVTDFELLADAGAFVDYAKTELIDGDVYVMNSQWARHSQVKSEIHAELVRWRDATGSDLRGLVEVSVRVASDSMPEPDLVLTRWRGDRAVPAEEVALVVEVSDTTLDADLGRKQELYAAAGIAEYWVVDVGGRRVIVHDRPAADGYEHRREVPFSEPLAAATITGLAIATDRLLD